VGFPPAVPDVATRTSASPLGEVFLPEPATVSRPVLASPWQGIAIHILLFVLTAASVWTAAEENWPGRGWHFAVALLSILFAHEMGHYVACRFYRVDATLPFFLPSPWIPVGAGLWAPLSFIGTFGAVIRIRARIPNRKALFDIGVAGPLAGFLVLLPILYFGIGDGTWVAPPPPTADGSGGGIGLGEPLLFRLAARHVIEAPGGMVYNIGPLGLAAWFGLLVTALNLIPVGQLDGGHAVHALLPRGAHRISRLCLVAAIGLLYFRPFWLLWTILLWTLGRRPHPRTIDEAAPVGGARVAVGILTAAVLVLCFTPSPILVSWRQFGASLQELLELLPFTSR
jgi:membrane-associated protease RseP (regulator of RpoE activity)